MIKRKSKKYELISISHFFPPQIGGLENMAYNLIDGISNKGIKSLAIFSSNGKYLKEENFDTLTFRTLNIFNNTYPLFGPTFFLKVFKILSSNPDAKVIIHSRHLTSSLITAFTCIFLKHPYTVIEHNAGPIFLKSKTSSSIINWLDQNIFSMVLEFSEDILAVSNNSKEWISKNFNISDKRIDVIYNSFDTSYSLELLEKKENMVVFASKWIKVKDPNTTLKAYEYIADKYPNWNFVIVGEGKDLNYKNRNLPQNIIIMDKLLPQEKLFNILKKSKIYINSSLSEGLALGILEAISFGNIPVMSNAKSNIEIANILGIREYTFTRKNWKELARTVEKAMYKSRNKKYIESLVMKNEEIFSKDRMIEKYYERLLPRHFRKESTKKLSIVIPVYNEERTILKILDKVASLKLPEKIEKEIIIVNDSSTDSTRELIDVFVKSGEYPNNEYIVLDNKKNKGKSQSVRKGVLASTGDFVVSQDADLEYRPKDLITFLDMFQENNNIDVIYGNRFNSKNKFSNTVHSSGNRFLTSISNIFTRAKGFAPTDMETCYKMVRGDVMRSLFKSLESKSNFGLEPELTAKLVRYRKPNGKRLKFKEIEIYYKPRTISQGKKMRWFKHGFEALLEILYFNTTSFTVEEYFKGEKIKRQF
ncbi:MAG: glycosyltransferase [Candidatus Dojkabacteria bacterium]